MATSVPAVIPIVDVDVSTGIAAPSSATSIATVSATATATAISTLEISPPASTQVDSVIINNPTLLLPQPEQSVNTLSSRPTTVDASSQTECSTDAKGFGAQIWRFWKKIGPFVHLFFFIVDLVVLSWNFQTMIYQWGSSQASLRSTMKKTSHGLNASIVSETKVLAGLVKEIHDLRGQVDDLNRVDRELATWDRMNSYIQTCLNALIADVQSPECEDAIRQVGVAPPLVRPQLPSITLQVERKWNSRFPATIMPPSITGIPGDMVRRINYTFGTPSTTTLQLQFWIFLTLTFLTLAVIIWGLLTQASGAKGVHGRVAAFFHSVQTLFGQNSINHLAKGRGNEMSSLINSGDLGAHFATALNNDAQSRLRRRRPARTVWWLALKGDLHRVKEMIAEGLDINGVDPLLGTPLAAAAQGDHKSVVAFLLQEGANTDMPGGKYGTPLQAAASSNSISTARLLLDAKADIDAAHGAMGTALMIALQNRFMGMADLLLSKGANTGIIAGPYGSALQAAVSSDLTDMIKRILSLGANVDCESGEHGTALQIACSENNSDLVAFLLDHGASLEHVSVSVQTTPLQIACNRGFETLAKMLIARNANVDLQDEVGKTPLHDAARSGSHSLASCLIARQKIDINKPDHDLWTPLHHAAVYGHDKVVRVLLENGADVAAADKFNAHALFRAAGVGHLECTRLLLAHGSPVNATDTFGRTALHGPPEGEDVRIPELLLFYKADVNAGDKHGKTALYEAANVGNLADVQLLLSVPGIKSSLQNNNQETALLRAVSKCGHADQEKALRYQGIAQLLLQRPDADINARSGSTLQSAIVSGCLKIVLAMLSAGASINVQGGEYGSAVGAAAFIGNLEILQLLITRGANVNILGGEFGNPLQAAAVHGHVEVVASLLANGAKVNAVGGKWGCSLNAATTTLDAAIRMSNWDLRGRLDSIVLTLIKAGAREGPIQRGKDHRNDSWCLTPGGWGWLSKGGYDNVNVGQNSEYL